MVENQSKLTKSAVLRTRTASKPTLIVLLPPRILTCIFFVLQRSFGRTPGNLDEGRQPFYDMPLANPCEIR